MFIRDTRKVYRSEIEKNLGKDASGEKVLDYMFGTYDNDYNSNSDITIRKWGEPTQNKIIHRINMIWAIPLTLIILPLQYLITGNTGWDTKTKLGRWILKITGHLTEGK